MDIISAYQQVGSYRGAAVLCGTTPKTVKRVVEKFESGDTALPRAERATIPDSAHLPNLDNPGPYNAVLRAFLSRNTAAAR